MTIFLTCFQGKGAFFGIPCLSRLLWWLAFVPRFIGHAPRIIFPWNKHRISSIVGWGYKSSGLRARRVAARYGKTCCLLEDGFLRSVGLGGSGDPPLSLVVDDLGIYYDASTESRLERLIKASLSPAEMARAERCVALWRAGRVSKYNHLREFAGALPENYVLVVDQTFGDASILHGLADAGSFRRMLDAALAENPHSTVVLKTHPAVFAGYKRGHFDFAELAKNPRIVVLAEDVHPVRLIEQAAAVYVVTSQMGFEGLLWGKRVRTFGMPFYAGWGLTEDALPAPDRRCRVALGSLVHAALIAYPRYVDPETQLPCEAERVMEWMGMQRRMRERFPPVVRALGFSPWKHRILEDFLQGSSLVFGAAATTVPDCPVVVWGNGASASSPAARVEDGFLRSVGLGADLTRPISWVIDRQGIYYDASRPSDLETLLNGAVFDDALLARAGRLRERIVAEGISKYNVGRGTWCRPPGAQRVILVPGQVENDASIRLGFPDAAVKVRRNVELLRAVRDENPDAYIVYKPHPDVVAGLREQGGQLSGEPQLFDEMVNDLPMHELLQQVDEVHVMTSLTGFEALLRGKRVVCHGLPFYAGWGLTDDRSQCSRRQRRVSLDALVAASLILYPTYVSRATGRFTTPERALDELLSWRVKGPERLPHWRQVVWKIERFFRR